jgi:cold shock CspA family protein
MTRETFARSVYLLFGIACVGNGLWMLVDPVGWNGLLRMQAEDFTGDGALNIHMMRKLGATYLCVSLAFFWCMVNSRIRSRVHPALTLFFGLIAAIQALEISSSQVPSHRWVTDAPFVLLPPLVLALMMIPLPRLPVRGGETGKVKWFDSKKGFGFIVRANGEELFVHYRSIRGKGHRGLKDGQPVRFRVGQGAKGPQAEDVEPLDGPA